MFENYVRTQGLSHIRDNICQAGAEKIMAKKGTLICILDLDQKYRKEALAIDDGNKFIESANGELDKLLKKLNITEQELTKGANVYRNSVLYNKSSDYTLYQVYDSQGYLSAELDYGKVRHNGRKAYNLVNFTESGIKSQGTSTFFNNKGVKYICESSGEFGKRNQDLIDLKRPPRISLDESMRRLEQVMRTTPKPKSKTSQVFEHAYNKVVQRIACWIYDVPIKNKKRA